MDRRSWPWKKRSSDRPLTGEDTNGASLPNSGNTKTVQDDAKNTKYIQIPLESYTHLTELEDQVNYLNDTISNLDENLSSAQSEIITKENLVKQHTKVAEEAVSGWEKAEAEASALKQQLESVTLLKLSAEERASHLDGALKECMKQVRNVKEESEQKLHDVIFAKTKKWEKARAELEIKIVDFEQELQRSSAENVALARTLQERSTLLMKISDEKSQADAEIEALKNDIQSCEREITSMKYEVHVISKQLEIRDEEKNMSMRSAEVANKQHVEDVKKIAKLEAECQRLRALVRKKLPGPAALAQMKLEVENLGRDNGEMRLRRSPAKSSSPHHASPYDFALEDLQQSRKENEFLTVRLLTMEEEMKMLKEALLKRNSELQVSRNACAKTANKLHSVEGHFLGVNRRKSPMKSITEMRLENESNPASITSISLSEYGIDEEGSCSESWASALVSELSHFEKEKNLDSGSTTDNSNQLELMDDFLEMERLACLSSEPKGSTTNSDGPVANLKTELVNVQKEDMVGCGQQASELASNTDDFSLSKLQSRITCLFESQLKGADMEKLLEDIRCIVQDALEELRQNGTGSAADESCSDSCMQKECIDSTRVVTENGFNVKQDLGPFTVDEFKDAISQINYFVVSIGKESTEIQGRSSDYCGLTERIEEFCASVDKVLCNEVSVTDFLIGLSHILSETSFLGIMSSDKGHGREYSTDCIDKVTLLENKVAQHGNEKEILSEACVFSSPSSYPEVEGPISLGLELPHTSHKCSLEEFEQLKLEKEKIEKDLAKCKEMVELTNHQLEEMEQYVSEFKSQLAASEKSNSLAETQLKCMAESYKSLESQKQDLETELILLRERAELLDKELQEEKQSHEDDLTKYRELQDQIESKCTICSANSDTDADVKIKQGNEIAAAAEKLAECQETILLLGKQLNSLRPASEPIGSSPNNMQQTRDASFGDEASTSPHHFDRAETEYACTWAPQRRGGQPPLNVRNSHRTSPSDAESVTSPASPFNSKPHKHRSSSRSSSSSSSKGIGRFFSKGKSEH